MNDRQLSELLRMAAEIDAIEADASSVAGRIGVGAPGRLRVRRLAWAGLSAAAAIALGAGAFITLRGAPVAPQPVPPGAIAHVATPPRPEPPQVRPDPAPAVARIADQPASPGMLLAIYQDILGTARCVQLLPMALAPGESLAQLSRDEMLHADEVTKGSICAGGPHRLFVVALSGPVDSLPRSEASAEALASCIASSRDMCSESPSSYADAASTCLPPGVNVRVESTLVLR